jgi:translocation and assembly module TamB
MPRQLHAEPGQELLLAARLSLQHRERVLTRRARAVLWSLGIVAALGTMAAIAVLALVQTDWGHERIRRVLVSRTDKLFNGHGRLQIGRITGGFGGHFAADSVAIMDEGGRVIFAVSHAEADATLTGLLSNSYHLTRLLVVRPYAYLQYKDSTWNFERLVEARPPGATPTRSTLALALDQAELRDGHIILVTPDSLPTMQPVVRDFSGIQLAIGRTQVLHPDMLGGVAPVQRLALVSTRPPVTLREAAGTVRWWHDSLGLDFTTVHLPATHATVRGGIAWAAKGPAHINLLVHADTVSLADVAWVTPVIPKHGDASTDIHIHNGAERGAMDYVLTNLDLRATRSRLTGGLTASVGRGVSVTNLAIDAQPVDLDLVRELLGDSVPKKVWQGSLTGTIRGRGGPLTAMRLDEVNLVFTDRRANGATSAASLSGELAVFPKFTELHGFDVQLHTLDVHTLGAAIAAADSMHGVLAGRLVLDGPTRDLRFHELSLTHIDGDRPRSHFSGEGRLATDQTTQWFDASLSLDTLAVATVMRDRTTVPWQGALSGTLELHATRDTMSINTFLRVGAGSVRFVGTSLLDSTRTAVQGEAVFERLDPRVVIARKEIPFLRLGGRAGIEVEGDKRLVIGHADVTLDTTSVVGDSRLSFARVRASADSTGLHVDTAEVHAEDWRLSARGRLARTGVTHDSLVFKVDVDSLAVLHTLLLDSAGKALVDSLHGAVAAAGVLVGSLDTLSLNADFGVRDARLDGVTVLRGTGHAALERLPHAATGFLTFVADSAGFGGYTASRVAARAVVRDGRGALVTADIAASDTLSTRLVADVLRTGDTTRVSLDTLGLVIGTNRWRLDRPTRIVVLPDRIQVDSTVFKSARGATLAMRATLPDSGSGDGTLSLDGMRPAELEFTGLFSPNLDGRLHATAAITGTRDSPRFTFSAAFDSVKVSDLEAPWIAATGKYENRRVHAEAVGSSKGREMIRVTGDLPIDLALRSVPKRLLDDSLTVKIKADSATLAGLEVVVPNVEGLSGTLGADLDVRGTWKQVTGSGTVTIRDGAFTLPKTGTVVQGMVMDDTLANDSVRVHAKMSDSEGPRNTMTIDGPLWLTGGTWQSNLTSVGRGFRLIDDPELASGVANWLVHITGPIKSPVLDGDLAVLSGSLIIGRQRAIRILSTDTLTRQVQSSLRRMRISSLLVLLGNDVRLKSKATNVKLAGEVELSGPVRDLSVDGELFADRGTYLVNFGVIKRTFQVDSGTVRLGGRLDIPVALDLWTSYVVRRLDQEDLTIVARLTGTSTAPRLDLSSTDLGTSLAQSEIISYLIFGAPSFAVDATLQGTINRGYAAAVVPWAGGILEGALGTVLPFFTTLTVATIVDPNQQALANPVDGLINSFVLTAGRQLGTESFLNLSGGVCRASQLSSTQSPGGWGSLSLEYRPKYKLSAVASIGPVSSPCYGLGRYQTGLDFFKDWRF